MNEWEVRCPECGTEPRFCPICGDDCCACYHDDDPKTTPDRNTP